ncbi:MAG TPA: ComEA family DNA-binding protein [Stenomitos sp.]
MRGILLWLLMVSLGGPAWGQTVVLEGVIRVHVQGLVKHPGLYRLFPGARRADAIQAAGGILPGAQLEGLSLAAALNDGDSLLVPRQGTPISVASPPPRAPHHRRRAAAASRPASPFDLNTATAEQLDSLPGIGPSIAGDIVGYRKQHGRFRSLDELREVAGIGESRLRRLKPLLKV